MPTQLYESHILFSLYQTNVLNGMIAQSQLDEYKAHNLSIDSPGPLTDALEDHV